MAEVAGAFRTSFLPPFPQALLPQRPRFASPPASSRRGEAARCSISMAPSSRAGIPEGSSIPWGCDIESLENAEELQRWLSASGLPPQKMAIERVEVGERGLVALKNIRKGEKLLFVPPSLVITTESEWSSSEAGNLLKKYCVPDWPYLATYLISEASFANSSRWSRYISALPQQPYSLLYWTRAELDAYLVASPIRERAIERINSVTGTYNDLRERIFSKHPDLFPEEVFNMETFQWSLGILFSRLVRLPSMDGKVALVPWADMLNHSPEVEAFLDYDKSSRGIVFTTDRSYQPGDQVFISYGKKSNGELLLSYGFVPREGSNPNDSVDLLLPLNKSDKCYKEKKEALRKNSLSSHKLMRKALTLLVFFCLIKFWYKSLVGKRFPLQVTGWPVEMMAYAYLVVSPPNMSQHFGEMASAAASNSTSRKGIKFPELEERALQFILDQCELSIAKYNKYIEGSSPLGSTPTSPGQVNRKVLLKKLASDLSASERRILFRTQYIIRRRLRDMRMGGLRALSLFDGVKKLFK